MEIILAKDPFEYRIFKHILKFDQEKLDNNDAKMLGMRICKQLNEITKMRWMVRTCVGGKCTIATSMIPNKKKRQKWKGEKVVLNDVPFIS
jgi:hypothetical protein